ncbi:MAG: PorV/PorQ family protein [Elusimicrobia bacterium]|nr:PorV/PorQ family protein [Elusimicrobiota bacterium]
MKITTLALLALLTPAAVRGGETAAFLKLGVGARAVGMGGAYTALANDVNALGWNPAGLSSLNKRELGAMHAELAAQTRYDFIGYAQPVKYGTLGVGAVYLSHGGLEGRSETGAPTGTYGASDQAVSLGLASRLDAGLRLGANVKYIRSSIANVSAQSFALDLGGQYALKGVRGPGLPLLGVSVQNLGPGMKYLDQTSQLPLTMAAGIGYQLPVGLTFAMDFKHRPHSRDSELSVGTEYALLANFALRAGYATQKAYNGTRASAGGFSALSGFATGLGFKMKAYSLDYAFTPAGEMGNVQRFSLGARW